MPPLKQLLALALPVFLLPLASCQKSAESATPLKTAVLNIESQALKVEIADTPAAMERGLMFREKMAENEGMLFVFAAPKQAIFWMRNTRIPLSVAYLDRTGCILEIHDMFPYDETAVASSSPLVCYALEVNQGWFSSHHISPGSTVRNLPGKSGP